jgi:hypothetical protein
MWVPKSTEENERDLKREALKAALFMGVISFIAGIISVKFGYDRWSQTIDPISWSKLLTFTPWIILISLIVSVIFYYSEKSKERHKNTRTLVCLKCGASRGTDTHEICSCGERMVDLNHSKWIRKDSKDAGSH